MYIFSRIESKSPSVITMSLYLSICLWSKILSFINIIHEESWISMLNCKKTEIYKKSVINMGTKLYNNLPEFLKETDDYRAFKKELKLFLLLQTFYSVEEFVSS
jgi:hypothetical protein